MARHGPYHAAPFRRESGPVRLFAHRGASADAPENSRAAFAEAVAQGADGIECDVRLAGDGALVVCHDDELLRLTGDPRRLSTLPLEELQRLPLLHARFPGHDERIPTLVEAIAAAPALAWNVELKVDRTEEAEPLARALVAALPTLGLRGPLLVSSFHPHALLTLRAIAKEVPTALLWEADARAVRWLAPLAASAAVHPDRRGLTAEEIARWRRRGFAVNVWTVDEPARARELAEAGVDALVTNRPGALRRALGEGR